MMTHDSEELLDICSVVFFCSLFRYPKIRSDTVCLEVPHGWPCVKLQMPCSCWAGMAAGPFPTALIAFGVPELCPAALLGSNGCPLFPVLYWPAVLLPCHIPMSNYCAAQPDFSCCKIHYFQIEENV